MTVLRRNQTDAMSHQGGQSLMEYNIVCAVLIFAIGIGGDSSMLEQLIDAFKTAYQDINYAISLPD
jgi:hypothetical protein